MMTTTTIWSAVMRRLVDGGDVTLEELYEAATLASKADDRLLPSQWLSVAAELKRQTDIFPMDPFFRFIAWQIGAAAALVEEIEAATGEPLQWVA